MERLNNDIVIFLILAAIPLVYYAKRWRMIGTIALIALAGILKFYPIILFPAVFILYGFSIKNTLWVMAGLTFTFTQILFAGEFFGPLSLSIPRPNYFFTFGGENLFRLLQVEGWITELLPILIISVFLLVGITCLWKKTRSVRLDRFSPGQINLNEAFFLIGAVIVCGCFVLRSGFSYRLIFVAFSLPYVLDCISSSKKHSKATFAWMWIITFALFTFLEPLFLHVGFAANQAGYFPESLTLMKQVILIYCTLFSIQWVFVLCYLALSLDLIIKSLKGALLSANSRLPVLNLRSEPEK
jgi:hypothetical protein